MRWFSRSTRKDILDDISFKRRGQILSGGGNVRNTPITPGQGYSPEGAKSRHFILIGLFLFLLLVVGIYSVGYLRSEQGQRAVQDIISNIKKWTFDHISDFFARVYTGGDYFSTNTNPSSQKKGIDLVAFRSIAGDTIAPGGPFDLLYEIEYFNVPNTNTYPADFSCYFNTSNKDTPANERRDGEIISNDPGTIRKGSTTVCRIPGAAIEGLDGAYTFFGSFSFNFQTEDAVLPVYFIPGELADQLGDKDFFEAYDLGIRQSDLKVVYNGEPISVAIGVGEEGEERQPVILRNDGTLSYNTIGITLTNEWQGDIQELSSFTLSLPENIRLNEELNGEPHQGCPFIPAGREKGKNTYILDESIRQELFGYYIQNKAFFGKVNYRTFQCWTEADADFFGEAPYVVKSYEVDLSYRYRVKEQQDTISIVPRGDSLVVEGGIT